jgi:hypothetical protein
MLNLIKILSIVFTLSFTLSAFAQVGEADDANAIKVKEDCDTRVSGTTTDKDADELRDEGSEETNTSAQ